MAEILRSKTSRGSSWMSILGQFQVDFCLCGKNNFCAKLIWTFFMKIKSFSCEKFCTSTQSEKEANSNSEVEATVSLHMSQVAHQAGAYPGFCSM